DALLRLDAQIDRLADGRPQRWMRPRLQYHIAHLDVKIQILAEEILGVDGGLDDGLALRGGGLELAQFEVLGPYRDDHRCVLGQALARLRLDLADGRADDTVDALKRGDGAADEISGADEVGDELIVRLLVDLARGA